MYVIARSDSALTPLRVGRMSTKIIFIANSIESQHEYSKTNIDSEDDEFTKIQTRLRQRQERLRQTLRKQRSK